jgi:pilus assembly protein CpaF
MSGIDISPRSARGQIASAINVVIQIGRLSDGKRKVLSLSELTGMEGDTVTMQEIFRFKLSGRDDAGNVLGHFEATGIRPRFASELAAWGINLDPALFKPQTRFDLA